jgi:hypothetical protein
MKKEIKIVDGYYNNQEVVIDSVSEYEDYYLVHYADSTEQSKFKINAGELKQEADEQD